jgi:hypothetical protein
MTAKPAPETWEIWILEPKIARATPAQQSWLSGQSFVRMEIPAQPEPEKDFS